MDLDPTSNAQAGEATQVGERITGVANLEEQQHVGTSQGQQQPSSPPSSETDAPIAKDVTREAPQQGKLDGTDGPSDERRADANGGGSGRGDKRKRKQAEAADTATAAAITATGSGSSTSGEMPKRTTKFDDLTSPPPTYDKGRYRDRFWKIYLPRNPPPPPRATLEEAPVIPLATCSWISELLYLWISPMMTLGVQRSIQGR